MTICVTRNETTGVVTGMAGLFASLIAGMACIGPLMGIAMGISGLGWMSGYSHLSVPASITSLVLSAVAVFMYTTRRSCCASKRRHYMQRALLISAVLLVVAINAFEFLIFPNM